MLRDLKRIAFLCVCGAQIEPMANLALEAASLCGHVERVQHLLDNFGPPLSDALESAALRGHSSIVQYFIKKGANGLENTLAEAAYKSRVDVMSYLLDNGANINANEGQMLLEAIAGGQLEVVKILLERGAVVGLCGEAALTLAAEGGHLDIVELLIEQGVEVEVGRAFRQAADMEYRSIVEYLLSKEADINKSDESRGYILIRHMREGDMDVICFVLDHLNHETGNTIALDAALRLLVAGGSVERAKVRGIKDVDLADEPLLELKPGKELKDEAYDDPLMEGWKCNHERSEHDVFLRSVPYIFIAFNSRQSLIETVIAAIEWVLTLQYQSSWTRA
ncbi:hypothetical protein HK097_007228 [Rhizophlyctis rosea]|uniref:Ankyrin n=1 Tax=Rhizophlyctis rosea TaxID=64517 RepID=A0AAD5SF03_9FUNG|nr:hypothetical protein HK097_007228 [Rhizophlyctis rosea]